MSAHGKATVMPSTPQEPLGGTSFTTLRTSTSRTEALCQEVPIRTLGARVTYDPKGTTLKGESFEEESTTMLLFPQGAVIRLAAPVACGQDLMLVNKRTNRYVHCRVTNLRTSPDVKSYVEVEFTHANPNFWGISFPKDAAKAAPAAFAPEMPFAPPVDPRIEATRAVLAKALAADVGAEPTMAGATMAVPAGERAAATSPRAQARVQEAAGPISPAPFFRQQQMAAMPVSEPVAAHVEAAFPVFEPVAEPEEVEAPPAPLDPQLMNWDAISVPARRPSRMPIAAGIAAVFCTIILGYLFYAPAQQPLPTDLQAAPSPLDNLRPANAATTSAHVVTEGPITVTAVVPEVTPMEARRGRVVLPGKMILPVHNGTRGTHDAPELPATSGGDAGTPGKALGLFPAATPEAPPLPAPEPVVEKTAEPADAVTPARVVASVQPVYPLQAKLAHIEGSVKIEAAIDASGKIVGMKVLAGPAVFREAALSALAQWKFAPARLRNHPTPSTTIVMLRFVLH